MSFGEQEEDAEVLREPVKAKGAVEQREVASTGGKKWSKASLVVVVRVARRNGAPMVGTDGEAVAGALLGTAELMEVAAWLGVVGNDSKRRPELVKVMVEVVASDEWVERGGEGDSGRSKLVRVGKRTSGIWGCLSRARGCRIEAR